MTYLLLDRKQELMYINDWVMIQDIGRSKGFRGICSLRVPFSGFTCISNIPFFSACFQLNLPVLYCITDAFINENTISKKKPFFIFQMKYFVISPMDYQMVNMTKSTFCLTIVILFVNLFHIFYL